MDTVTIPGHGNAAAAAVWPSAAINPGLPSSGSERRRARAFDLDGLEHALPGARLDPLLLERPRLKGLHRQILAADAQLDYLLFPAAIALRGSWHPGRVSIILTVRVNDRWSSRGLPHTGGSLSLWNAGAALDAHLPAGTEWIVLSLDQRHLDAEIARGNPGRRQRNAGVQLRIPAQAAAWLVHALEPILSDNGFHLMAANDWLESRAIAAFVSALCATESQPGPCPVALRRHRLVRRAEAHMRTHPFESIRMRPLSRTVGASERLLEYAFREMYEMGAIAFLRTVRFNGARKALLGATADHATVTQIAMDWGFSHLSEFAGKYRQLFGELPSDTLRRADKAATATPTLI
jgi:AraC-like DNA-binding protein